MVRNAISGLAALLLLAIPGLAAAYGFNEMRLAFLEYFASLDDLNVANPHFPWGKFLIGAVLFLAGVGFIGGWIFYRDRKRNYVASRIRPRQTPPRSGEDGETP